MNNPVLARRCWAGHQSFKVTYQASWRRCVKYNAVQCHKLFHWIWKHSFKCLISVIFSKNQLGVGAAARCHLICHHLQKFNILVSLVSFFFSRLRQTAHTKQRRRVAPNRPHRRCSNTFNGPTVSFLRLCRVSVQLFPFQASD